MFFTAIFSTFSLILSSIRFSTFKLSYCLLFSVRFPLFTSSVTLSYTSNSMQFSPLFSLTIICTYEFSSSGFPRPLFCSVQLFTAFLPLFSSHHPLCSFIHLTYPPSHVFLQFSFSSPLTFLYYPLTLASPSHFPSHPPLPLTAFIYSLIPLCHVPFPAPLLIPLLLFPFALTPDSTIILTPYKVCLYIYFFFLPISAFLSLLHFNLISSPSLTMCTFFIPLRHLANLLNFFHHVVFQQNQKIF